MHFSLTLFAVAKATKNSIFLVTSLRGTVLRGSNLSLLSHFKTTSKFQPINLRPILSLSKDLIKSDKSLSPDKPRPRCQNTEPNIALYPLMVKVDNSFVFFKYKKKSATCAKDVLEEETPSLLHQSLKTFLLAWYTSEDLLHSAIVSEAC